MLLLLIAGVEQATNSVPLQSYSFPRASVLLLGNEQSGIPAHLLHLLDVCVEIPTLGESFEGGSHTLLFAQHKTREREKHCMCVCFTLCHSFNVSFLPLVRL